ncbi:MAG: hypothetical protein D6733_06940 [Methanobacteriota archaeon]|nr:MAG: hypothetical protein D6733_06940 [Euryarchaeota archaeon]
MLDVEGKGPAELSKIGDPFVNFLYSLALSKAFMRPLGRKVSNFILAEAVVRSGLRDRLGSRLRRGDLGDIAEGLIFMAWAQGKMDIGEAVEILAGPLSTEEDRLRLREESVKGFEKLLRHVAELCLI